VESTTEHRPAGDVLPAATAGSPRALWRAARVAVAALVAWAVIDMLNTVIAVGHYENRITVVSHGEADVLPAWLVYALFNRLMPFGMVTTVAARLWMIGLLVAGIAFITWLVLARRNAGLLGGAPAWASSWAVGGWFIPVANLVIPYRVVRDVRQASGLDPLGQATAMAAPVGRWWAGVIVTALLNRLVALYSVLTSYGGMFKGEALDTRLVAYPLWTAGTVALVVTAILGARVVLRITEAACRDHLSAGGGRRSRPPPWRPASPGP
jgi:hypothetical protein